MGALFTDDAAYVPEPFAERIRGLGAIARFWEAEREGPDEVFSLESEVVAEEGEEDWSPVVIRQKVFPAARMTHEDAVDHMELVGHDFFLFIDAATDNPSVVYRRKGWDYGVIGLGEEAEAERKRA